MWPVENFEFNMWLALYSYQLALVWSLDLLLTGPLARGEGRICGKVWLGGLCQGTHPLAGAARRAGREQS